MQKDGTDRAATLHAVGGRRFGHTAPSVHDHGGVSTAAATLVALHLRHGHHIHLCVPARVGQVERRARETEWSLEYERYPDVGKELAAHYTRTVYTAAAAKRMTATNKRGGDGDTGGCEARNMRDLRFAASVPFAPAEPFAAASAFDSGCPQFARPACWQRFAARPGSGRTAWAAAA